MADVRIHKVLVGADPSAGAQLALQWAAGLAGRCDAELVVAHARGLLEDARDHGGDPIPAWMTELSETLDPAIAVSLQVALGPPPEALLRIAGDVGADLIVVGRRGTGSPFDLSLGSTSRELSSRATVPVVVVPVG